MPPRNIFAWTPPTHPYPEFVSLNETGGQITLTVRGPKRAADPPDYPHDLPGHTVEVVLPRAQLTELACRLAALVADKA